MLAGTPELVMPSPAHVGTPLIASQQSSTIPRADSTPQSGDDSRQAGLIGLGRAGTGSTPAEPSRPPVPVAVPSTCMVTGGADPDHSDLDRRLPVGVGSVDTGAGSAGTSRSAAPPVASSFGGAVGGIDLSGANTCAASPTSDCGFWTTSPRSLVSPGEAAVTGTSGRLVAGATRAGFFPPRDQGVARAGALDDC